MTGFLPFRRDRPPKPEGGRGARGVEVGEVEFSHSAELLVSLESHRGDDYILHRLSGNWADLLDPHRRKRRGHYRS